MPDQNALLSASVAHRWLECPPPATLEVGLPESSSQAAEQVTAAHALAEWKLRRVLQDAPTTKPVSSWHDAQLGKKRFTTLLGDLVAKPAVNPTLVPEFDKRLALEIQSAAIEITVIK